MGCPNIFAAADSPLPPGPEGVESHWARIRGLEQPAPGSVLLVLDEVQKVRGWSEVVKRLWDEDRRAKRRIHVLLLGSSALLLTKGLAESLTGRFFLHRCPHWTWPECEQAFGLSLEQWLYFGGPGGRSRSGSGNRIGSVLSRMRSSRRSCPATFFRSMRSRNPRSCVTFSPSRPHAPRRSFHTIKCSDGFRTRETRRPLPITSRSWKPHSWSRD